MNFTFEGNYKSKRNINLGGNKAQVDKKSLLAKAQSERKAREQERLRWKSALKIQSFFRGRRAAHVIYQQEYSLLQQQLSSLDSLINQPFDSITTATTIITPLVVSCIRQVLLLSHSSRMAYSTCIGKLSQVMISDISIGDKPEKYTVIQLLLLNDLYEMDSKIWLLVLLVGRAILPTLTNEISSEIDVSTTYQALAYLVQLVDPITCSILDKHTSSASLESRGIYIRMMTHLILKDNLFHSLHILLRQLVEYKHMATTMPKTDSHFGMIMNILFSCLDNLQPPYDYPASTIGNLRPPTIHPPTFSSFTNEYTSITFNQTSPPLLLSRQRLLDIFVQEILSVPFLLQDDNGDLLQLVTSKLPIDSILKTILFHYCDDSGDKWQLETDTVAGLLMNLTMLTSYNANGKIQHFLIDYSHVLQTLLCNLPSHYLDDTKDKRNDTRMVLDSDSDHSDVGDSIAMTDNQNPATTAKNESQYIKSGLMTLYDSDHFDTMLHQFVNLIFQYTTQHEISATSSSMTQSIANLFVTFIIRCPTKKDHILNTLLYYHHHNRQQIDGNLSNVSLLQILWQSWLHGGGNDIQVFDESNGHIMDHLQEAVQAIIDSVVPKNWSILYLLCEMHTRLLLTIGDDEFFDKSLGSNQLTLEEMVVLGAYLKNISFVLFWRANILDVNTVVRSTGIQIGQLRNAITTLLQQIHMRDSRRRFCPKDHWLIYGLDTESFSSAVVAEEYALEENDSSSSSHTDGITSAFERRRLQHVKQTMSKARLAMVSPRLGLLNNIPFVISFEHRVQIFRMFVNNDRRRNDILDALDYVRPHAEVQIRRQHVFEDGFNQLYKLGPDLKKKIAIIFIDSFGLMESGIDGGGVFKEFLTSLGHEAFNTDYGLFSSTPDQLLYPNPSSFATEGSQLAYFEFLGLIIGKALYEGILLDVAFAEFFLKKCLGKINYLDDLPSLDPELYKGLIQVKNFKGNVEDLCLDFTLTENEADQPRVINLIPNGSNVLVTNQNRIRYVYLVANYRLNVQIAKQCKAFFNGLSTIVDTKWLRMFNQQELQVMLGGASVPIDIGDLRQHTIYADYNDTDPVIQNLWRALSSFSNEERMKFVKFVTSCSRPPILGFKELQPQICIRRAGRDESRLPTSSTCVNLLKLPSYSTYDILREKLLYSINADAGFDLS